MIANNRITIDLVPQLGGVIIDQTNQVERRRALFGDFKSQSGSSPSSSYNQYSFLPGDDREYLDEKDAPEEGNQRHRYHKYSHAHARKRFGGRGKVDNQVRQARQYSGQANPFKRLAVAARFAQIIDFHQK